MIVNQYSQRLTLTAIFVFGMTSLLNAQYITTPPEKVKKNYRPPVNNKSNTEVNYTQLNQDSLIRIKLVKLALDNPLLEIADANTRIAEEQLKKARSSWLSSVSVGANINEFVIQNSAAASFFPKYNIGAAVPLDIFSRSKREKAIGKENIKISHELKKDKERSIKAETLIRYEDYLEAQEKVFLQRTYLEYNFSAYEGAQHAFSNGEITLEEMNKVYQTYLLEKSNMTSRERDLKVTVIRLEEMIGQPLEQAMKLP